MKINIFKKMKISTKMYVFIGGAVLLIFLAFGFYISAYMSKLVDSTYEESASEYLDNFKKIITLEYENNNDKMSIAMDMTWAKFRELGEVTFPGDSIRIGSREVSIWNVGGKTLQLSTEYVDDMRSRGLGFVSIFQKIDGGYLRVATNVEDKDGKRALGSILDFGSPAVEAVENGNTFLGRAKVLDQWFLTGYKPIIQNGNVIGILGIGVPEIDYDNLSEYFKTKKYFGSGYPFLVDASGNITAHPKSVGKNLSDENFFKEMKEKKNGVVEYEWEGREKTQYFRYIDEIDSYITVGWYNEDFNEIFAELQTLIFVGALIAIMIIIAVLFITVGGIVRSINRAVRAAQEIAEGKMDADLSSDRQDEAGLLLNSMQAMSGSIKALVDEFDSLTRAAVNGQLERRADEAAFKGKFREIVEGYNETLEALIVPINVTADYVDRIAKGDIPPKITDEYKGDFNEIKNNLNAAIENLNALIYEMNTMSHEHDAGEIDYRINEERFSGAYKEMASGVNEMVFGHIQVKKDAMGIFEEFGKGNFEANLATLPGKKVFINHTINAVRDNLTRFNDELVEVTDYLKSGELNRRADTSGFSGGWHNMISGVNEVIVAFTEPISEAGDVLAVMATGDLTVRMSGDYRGEFDKFKNDINSLGDSLENLINQVNDTVLTTASSANEISASAISLSSSAQEQSSQAEEVASAVEEMSRTITENAMNASKTAEVADRSGKVAHSGGEIVQQTITKMRDISDVVSASARSISRLGDSSKQIGEIISVIDDIADQTNLLALNAAIEAARAGDQGRGFAVVADEVRKLAERTTEATKQIESMIKGIQQETGEAVIAMDRGTNEVKSGIDLADKAGSSLGEILESINQVLNMINQIAAASEEQSATSEEISKNVVSISEVSHESAQRVEDVSKTSDDLAQLTEHLRDLMSRFKVNKATMTGGSLLKQGGDPDRQSRYLGS